MSQRLTLAELQSRLGGTLQGDAQARVSGAAALESAGPDDLSFALSAKLIPAAQASGAGILITRRDVAEGLPGRACLVVDNPHATFARALELLFPEPEAEPGIHPSAVVHATARVAPDACIAAHAVIGAGATVGPRTRIGPNSVLGDGASIGADGRIAANVSIYPDCRLGERVTVHSGTVIGSDGFGYAPEQNAWLKVPQVGRVLIGNDVEIGANTTIDRGALDDTVIGDGVKIDNLVQIAHNCRIGDHTAIAGCAGIAGSTTIGRHCRIGGAAMILGHIEIGDGVTVSGASFIGKSIREPGIYTSTQPQMPHDEWLRNAAQLRHLSDMRDRIRALEKKLSELERNSP